MTHRNVHFWLVLIALGFGLGLTASQAETKPATAPPLLLPVGALDISPATEENQRAWEDLIAAAESGNLNGSAEQATNLLASASPKSPYQQSFVLLVENLKEFQRFEAERASLTNQIATANQRLQEARNNADKSSTFDAVKDTLSGIFHGPKVPAAGTAAAEIFHQRERELTAQKKQLEESLATLLADVGKRREQAKLDALDLMNRLEESGLLRPAAAVATIYITALGNTPEITRKGQQATRMLRLQKAVYAWLQPLVEEHNLESMLVKSAYWAARTALTEIGDKVEQKYEMDRDGQAVARNLLQPVIRRVDRAITAGTAEAQKIRELADQDAVQALAEVRILETRYPDYPHLELVKLKQNLESARQQQTQRAYEAKLATCQQTLMNSLIEGRLAYEKLIAEAGSEYDKAFLRSQLEKNLNDRVKTLLEEDKSDVASALALLGQDIAKFEHELKIGNVFPVGYREISSAGPDNWIAAKSKLHGAQANLSLLVGKASDVLLETRIKALIVTCDAALAETQKAERQRTIWYRLLTAGISLMVVLLTVWIKLRAARISAKSATPPSSHTGTANGPSPVRPPSPATPPAPGGSKELEVFFSRLETMAHSRTLSRSERDAVQMALDQLRSDFSRSSAQTSDVSSAVTTLLRKAPESETLFQKLLVEAGGNILADVVRDGVEAALDQVQPK
jgi:hypothetical protein